MPSIPKSFLQEKNSELLGSCPICDRSFEEEQATMMEEKDQSMLLHLQCPDCKSCVVVAVLHTSMGMVTTLGMMTDLTKKDIEKFKDKSQKLTVDDVLELHQFLKKN